MDLTEAFNHAARMSDPAYLRKEERRKAREQARIVNAGRGGLFIWTDDSWKEMKGVASVQYDQPEYDDVLGKGVYFLPKSITITFTAKYTVPRWYHRLWHTIRRFLVWISNLD